MDDEYEHRTSLTRAETALILQHFERGAKINDNSNRYAQTCKSCGEKFPKGRLDSLQNHIIKKCPALTIQQRQSAVMQFNNLPGIPNMDSLPEGVHMDLPLHGPSVALPVVNRNWTALETLAEVSRQIDMNEKHDDRSINDKSVGAGSRASEPPRNDRLELHEQYTLDNPPVSYEQRVQRDKKAQGGKSTRNDNDSSLGHTGFGNMSGARSESPLAMAAAAAARFQPSMVDPQLLRDDMNTQPSFSGKTVEEALSEATTTFPEAFMHQASEQQLTWPMVDGSGGHHYSEPTHVEQPISNDGLPRNGVYSRIAMSANSMTTEFSAEYGNGQKSDKHKNHARRRFDPERRKEVQKVRKIGACIRCRMLRKNCSQGTPCETCRGVESARLWKLGCVRTRIADEMTMYSAALHTVLAHHEINAAKHQTNFSASPVQIEASHYPGTNIFATFDSLEAQSVSVHGDIDPGLNDNFTTTTVRILDHEGDNLQQKLESYTTRMLPIFIKNEPSHFMNVTLAHAEKLQLETKSSILGRVLEFWAIVHILIDHETSWKISERVNIDAAAGDGPAIVAEPGSSFNLLSLQLNAATEKQAATLCKSVLIEIERHLMIRHKDYFETFLVTIITLNCVEKSTWLFKSWEQSNFKSRWPLEKTPAEYATQGEKLTDMLNQLMRIRGVVPKTRTEQNGILVTDEAAAKDYFEKLQLSYVDVLSKQANHTFDPADSRCYELRFCSHLLLPQAQT